MKNNISIQRIGLLIKNDIFRNMKTINVCFIVLAGLYLLGVFFGGGNYANLLGITGMMKMYTGVLCVILPFSLYSNLFHSVKGVAYGMIPATQTEKYLSSFLLCTVVFPVALIVAALLLSLISVLISGNFNVMMDVPGLFSASLYFGEESISWGFFDSWYWNVISMQSIAFWGVYFFKTKKFIKTVTTFFCVCIGLTMIASIFIQQTAGLYFEDGILEFINTSGRRIAILADIFGTLICPIGLWIFAWLKMKRQQF